MKTLKIKLLITAIFIGLPILLSAANAFAANTMTADVYTFTIVPDTTAPSIVSNLSISGSTENTVTLAWSATGDDAASGTATSYDIRYSTALITLANWASATQATGEPTPAIAGTSQTMTISSLSRETTYYFAIKVSDEGANQSGLSNVINTTTPDQTAPSVIANLSATGKTHNTVNLSWTAPGDNAATGTATSYDVRYSTALISLANWASATQAAGEPAPAIAGTTQTLSITGLSSVTKYYFAIRATDEASNQAGLSNVINTTTDATPDTTPPYTTGHVPAKDATNITTDSNIVLHVKDDGAGVDSSTIQMIVNGVSVSPLITGTPADYTLTYNPLSDFLNGQDVFITIRASDLAP
ncbi:MAG: fibronectin type III domain-containing protein [Candidatus Omnitrophica bacterium]|nr:fibronectin type III domain-containing protein [Candidatus Omnitrophota bacterium]